SSLLTAAGSRSPAIMRPSGPGPSTSSVGPWRCTRRPAHGTDQPPRADEDGTPPRPARRRLRAGGQGRRRLQRLSHSSLGDRMAGSAPGRGREPPEAGPLPLAEELRAIRLRLPTVHRPEDAPRAGGPEFRGARGERRAPGAARISDILPT